MPSPDVVFIAIAQSLDNHENSPAWLHVVLQGRSTLHGNSLPEHPQKGLLSSGSRQGTETV